MHMSNINTPREGRIIGMPCTERCQNIREKRLEEDYRRQVLKKKVASSPKTPKIAFRHQEGAVGGYRVS